MKKYEFTGETMQLPTGETLHRIRALIDIWNHRCCVARTGSIGGWIENEENLSHEAGAWVADEAKVYGDATVEDNAYVCDHAHVFEWAIVSGMAIVHSSAKVSGLAEISERACISNTAEITGNARVYGSASILGNARVSGNAHIHGSTNIYSNALITSDEDYLVIGPIGSRNGFTTFYRAQDSCIRVGCGCFRGTIDEFRIKVANTHGSNRYAAEYQVAADLAELRLGGAIQRK